LKYPNEWHFVTLGKYGRAFLAARVAQNALLDGDD